MLNQKPCDVCPYKLGIVKMIISPCPQCKKGGYEFFRQLKEHKKSTLSAEKTKDIIIFPVSEK